MRWNALMSQNNFVFFKGKVVSLATSHVLVRCNSFCQECILLEQESNFSVKDQIDNILEFLDHMVSVAITQFCRCSTKTSIDKNE